MTGNEVMDAANAVLSYMDTLLEVDHESVVKSILNETERAALARKLEEAGAEPLGAVRGGTHRTLLRPLNIPGDAGGLGQSAIQLLKATSRIIVGGQGRGRCIVVLSAKPVSELEWLRWAVSQLEADAAATAQELASYKAAIKEFVDRFS